MTAQMEPHPPGVPRAGPKMVRRYPLAPMQEGMLFQSLLDPGGGLNVEQGVMTLDGDTPLETGAFIAAWQQVLDHHETLRTAFCWKAGEPPSQEVVQPVRLPARVEEWGHLTSSEQQRRFNAFLIEDARRGFFLDRAPLMRLAIFRLGPGQARAVLTIHHLLYDGRSIIRMYQQAFEAYRGLIAAKPITLPPSPPYSDFVAWLHQNAPHKAESYWRGLLAGFQRPTPLGFGPTGYTDHPDQSPVDTIVQPLDSDLVRNLWKLANALDITPNTIIQGAWAILLSRYSGQTDVVWGNTRAGRKGTVRDADQMMGMFINTVPVRISVAGNADLADWLKRLRRQQLDVRPFQHSSLSDIQRWSDMSDSARLYQTLVAVEYFVHERRVARVCSRVLPMALRILGRTGLPLTLMVGLGEDAQWELLFEKSQVTRDHAQRMLRHLGTLLAEMVRNPRAPIADLSHLSADRRRKLLVDMNPSPRPYPREVTIHQLFDEQARSHPDATALIDGERILTYGQLRRQSDRLAFHLRELGVAPRDPVAVHLGRSLELVVAFLGILKAGGCYLPLDPFSPDIRLGYFIDDSKAELLITDQPGLPAFASVPPTILRPEDWPVGPEAPSLPPDGATSAEDPAYIIYTSGSTGDPKGVVVPHRGVVRLVFNHYLPFEAGLTFLMLAAPSFDASTLEIWGPMLRSGVCAICRPSLPRPRELQRLLIGYRVNCLWLTAALFNTIIDTDPRSLASVDYLMIGGEALSVDHVRRALAQLSDTRIINGYGPTENTTFTCTFPIPPALDPLWRSIPIGRSIDHTRVYVLDHHGQPVDIGLEGELCIGGDGLALGYLNTAEMTRQRFIPAPQRDFPDQRLYRSGDRVRILPGGDLEFLGRTDNQVKIRGFRIELGEIESALQELPMIKRCGVIIKGDNAEKSLAAYLVPESGVNPNPDDLRAALKRKLPAYMIPATFLKCRTLPLTVNGKLDRKALSSADAEVLTGGRAWGHEFSCTEKRVAAIWGELLGVPDVGLDQHFFDLGGHSLMAVELLRRIKEAFAADISLAGLLKMPTVRSMAAYLDTHRSAEPPSGSELLVLIHGSGSWRPIFASPGVGGVAMSYAGLARSLTEDLPFYGLQAIPEYPGPARPLTLQETAARFVQEIRTIQPKGPYRLLGYSFGGSIAYEMARQLIAASDTIELLAIIDHAPGGVVHRRVPKILARDIFWRLAEALRSPREQLYCPIRYRWKVWSRAGRSTRNQAAVSPEQPPKISDIVDMSGWPEAQQRIAQREFLAWLQYHPEAFPGRLHLFRARCQSLSMLGCDKMGWNVLAPGRVTVHHIPGGHQSMMEGRGAARIGEIIQRLCDAAPGD